MIEGVDHNRLVRFAESIVGRQDAEDVVQEVYLKFFSDKVPAFRGESKRETWVLSIVKHTALKWLDLRCRYEDLRLSHEDSYTPNYDDVIDVKTEISRLEPVQQRILALYAKHGSYRSVASVLGLTRNQVFWQLHQARRQLREKLA